MHFACRKWQLGDIVSACTECTSTCVLCALYIKLMLCLNMTVVMWVLDE